MRTSGSETIRPGDRGRYRSAAQRQPPADPFPLVRERKGTYQAVFEEIRKAGFVRARVDGETYPLDEEFDLDRYKKHTIEAVVDRLILRETENDEDAQAARSRLTDSVETALKFGDGYITVQILSQDNPRDIQFSEHLACPEHGSVITEIEPRTFSFNTPHGACPTCQGLGSYREIDPDMLIPNRSLSLKDGAIIDSAWNGPKEDGGYYWQMLEAAAKKNEIDPGSACFLPPQENFMSSFMAPGMKK